jgi:hypothetical protein
MRWIGLAVVLAISLALAPFSAEAQQAKRIATVVLLWDDFSGLPPNSREAFVQGLRDLGWVEGTNFRLEPRSAKTRELRPATAAEIVKLKPDVLSPRVPRPACTDLLGQRLLRAGRSGHPFETYQSCSPGCRTRSLWVLSKAWHAPAAP